MTKTCELKKNRSFKIQRFAKRNYLGNNLLEKFPIRIRRFIRGITGVEAHRHKCEMLDVRYHYSNKASIEIHTN